jgi:hypothetical protein
MARSSSLLILVQPPDRAQVSRTIASILIVSIHSRCSFGTQKRARVL